MPHITKPTAMTGIGAPPNSHPSSAALRMWSMRYSDAVTVTTNRTTSYQGTRSSGAFLAPGKIRNVNGSMHKIRR
jgi:hypothetical protein